MAWIFPAIIVVAAIFIPPQGGEWKMAEVVARTVITPIFGGISWILGHEMFS